MIRMLVLIYAFSIIGSAEANPQNKSNYWKKVQGIPKFDARKHSDGCSGGMSAGYAILPKSVHEKLGNTLPWRQCCVVHDNAYYYGGSKEEKATADEALKQCVKETLQGKFSGRVLGEIMRLAVTPGGSPYFNTPWRWSYGEDYRQHTND